MRPGPGWQLHRSDVAVVPATLAGSLFAPHSGPLYDTPPLTPSPCPTFADAKEAGLDDRLCAQPEPITTYSRFESAVLESRPAGSSEQLGASQEAPSTAPEAVSPADVLMYAGGLVWAAEFCPQQIPSSRTLGHASLTGAKRKQPEAPESGEMMAEDAQAQHTSNATEELLALSVHPVGVMRNKQGEEHHGPGAVQVTWPVSMSTALLQTFCVVDC